MYIYIYIYICVCTSYAPFYWCIVSIPNLCAPRIPPLASLSEFPSFSAAQRLHGHVANALMADSSALTKPMVWFVQQLGAPEIQQFIIIFTIV